MTQPLDYNERNRKRLRVTRNGLKPLLPSTEPLSVLPDELIREILLRLPARELLRLRSVCSSWRTLISSSQFAKEHVQRSIGADPRVAYHACWYHRFRRFGDFSVRSLFENRSKPTEVVHFEGSGVHEIVGSCNGLLCLLEVTVIEHGIMLWNPCTGLTSQLLKIRASVAVCGFGYDHVNDEYKFFAIVDQILKHEPHRSQTRIYTFCPKLSKKRTIQNIAISRIVGDRNGVFVPGTATLNWIACHDTLGYSVLSLDLVTETFTEFSLPLKDPDNETFMLPHLCVLNNCLAFCFNHGETHWSLWLMKEYGVPQSWTRLAMIQCYPPLFGARLKPLYIRGNTVLLAIASTSKIVLCNLDDGGLEFPLLEPTPLSFSMGLWFHVYHESLVSPSYRCRRSSSSEMLLIKP